MGKLARSQFEAIRELKIKKLKICYDFCGDGGSTYLESVTSKPWTIAVCQCVVASIVATNA